MEIHKNVHEPIISREDFEEVQKTFKSKPGKPKVVEKNIFAGFLKCSDCGSNLNYRQFLVTADKKIIILLVKITM
jgi:hypothetical protein